ncbi:MAG: hypothetical protein R3A47_05340 [Polyangiales bacterium]
MRIPKKAINPAANCKQKTVHWVDNASVAKGKILGTIRLCCASRRPPRSEIDTLAASIYGADLTKAVPAFSHITSVADVGGGAYRSIQIGEYSPKSEIDWLALHLARARADAIVVTGKILRDEPSLMYQLHQQQWGDALQRWRAARFERLNPPILAVISRRGDFDPEHPAFHGDVRPLIYLGTTADELSFVDAGWDTHSDVAPSISEPDSSASNHVRLRAYSL